MTSGIGPKFYPESYIKNDLTQLSQAKQLVKELVTNPLKKDKFNEINQKLVELIQKTPLDHKVLTNELLKLQGQVMLLKAAFDENDPKNIAALIKETAQKLFPAASEREKIEKGLQKEAQTIDKGAQHVKEAHSQDKKEQKSATSSAEKVTRHLPPPGRAKTFRPKK